MSVRKSFFKALVEGDARGYWLSSDGSREIPVPWGSEHTAVVAEHPNEFGLTDTDLEQHKRVGVGRNGQPNMDQNLMKKAKENGWIRVYAFPSYREVGFDFNSVSNRTKNMVYDFLRRHDDIPDDWSLKLYIPNGFVSTPDVNTTVGRVKTKFDFGDGH